MAGPTTGGDIKVNERPDQLRRKVQLLKQEVRLLDAYVKGLPAYGGVWRTDQGAPLVVPLTTAWSVVPGFSEDRPSVPKKVNVDYTMGKVEITETGVYGVNVSLVFHGIAGRLIGIGIRTDGVDPVAPVVNIEIVATNRDVLMTYTTRLSFMTVPTEFELVWQANMATNLNFHLGGWSVNRIDYNTPAMVNQSIF